MSGIDEILEKGRKLNLQRSHVPPKPVNRPNKNSKVRFAEENPSRINKLQFPGSFKHPICHHEADFTLNRSLLISDDHVRVLSRPRKVMRINVQKTGMTNKMNPSNDRITSPRTPDVSQRQSQTAHSAFTISQSRN